MADTSSYLLAGGSAELERLRLQARVWEPEAEALLDRMGVQAGWRCVDLGCGAMGILGPLSRRVGPQGHVIGVDTDATQLAAARAFVQEHHLDNVEVLDQDAYHITPLCHALRLIAPTCASSLLLSAAMRNSCRKYWP